MYDLPALFDVGVGGPILFKYADPHEQDFSSASLQSGDQCVRNRALQDFFSAGDAVEHVQNRLTIAKQQALQALELVTQAEEVFDIALKFHEEQHKLSNHQDVPFPQHTDKTLQASCKSIDWKGSLNSITRKLNICGMDDLLDTNRLTLIALLCLANEHKLYENHEWLTNMMKYNASGVFHKPHSLSSIHFRIKLSHEWAATLIGMYFNIGGWDQERKEGQKFSVMHNKQRTDGNPWTDAPCNVPPSPANSFLPQSPAVDPRRFASPAANIIPNNLSFGFPSPSVSAHYAPFPPPPSAFATPNGQGNAHAASTSATFAAAWASVPRWI